MNTKEYKKVLEEKLIKEFIERFYEKLGYYPVVMTKDNSQKYKSLKLNELEKCFDKFLPILGSKKASLSTRNRSRSVVELRFMFFYIARLMKYSLTEIGKYLGDFDHTSVIHGIKTFQNLYVTDVKFRTTYNEILETIKTTHESSIVDSVA